MALLGDDGDSDKTVRAARSAVPVQQPPQQRQQRALPARATEPEEQEQEEEETETEEDEDVGLGLDLDDRNLLIQLLMNQQISSGYPITSRLFERYMDKHYEATSCSLQGYRDAMEDEHVIYFNLKNNPNCSVFGVFDGHGGNLASKFVKAAVIPILEAIPNGVFDGKALIECVKQLDVKWIEFENKRKRLKDTLKKREQQQEEKQALQFTLDSDETEEEQEDEEQQEPSSTATKAKAKEVEEEDYDLEQEEDEFMKQMLSRALSDEKTTIKDVDESLSIGSNEYGSVGSTCVFSIVEHNEKADNYTVTTVNLGDSRAIVLKNEVVYIGDPAQQEKEEKEAKEEKKEQADDDEDEDVDIVEQSNPKQPEKLFTLYELTTDHKPTLEAERQRIEKAGGFIKFNRVDGDLALSRAIGDTKYKRNAALSHEEQKISCVPTVTQTQCNADDYLLVFCDGIVEYKNNVDVFHCLTKSIQSNIIDYDKQLELAKVVEAKQQQQAPKPLTPMSQTGQTEQVQTVHRQPETKEVDDEEEEEEEQATEDEDTRRLPEMTICEHLRESELNFLTKYEKLGLIPKHQTELKRLEKVLLELTEWALDTGSKDNMTAVLVKIGKTNIHNSIYQRVWNPCPFYKNKMEFNHIGDEIKDGNAATLDRFMRLFETDCAKLGWNMNEDYQNALLQKILYVNDLITTYQQKKDIQELIQMQTNKLRLIERERETQKKQKQKQKSKKRKKMDEDGEEGDNDNGNGNGNGNEQQQLALSEETPRKKRKLNE
eukprot:CAMPEP_0197037662 /NCGR_PEP_ID=MMETSP1384-20130603/14807_1 /TAXON_ID=29189 /ORGANISM="Ammonia sp." /LENGTH=770 /DNA_ID=CAMNT_0042467991 /DNA_START=141 /DNA_END=2453 /DNA_ORIENTATION=+